MGTHTDMHLLLSFPDHLADDAMANLIASTPVDEEGTPVDEEGTGESSAADDGDDDVSTAGVILQLGIFILIPVAMYFLLIRPRRRMVRDQQAVQRSVEVGDEVLLTSGVYGFITGFEEGSDVVWVEVDDDVQMRVTRAAISGKVNISAPANAGVGEDGSAASGTSTTSTRPTLKGGTSAKSSGETESPESVDG